MIPSQLPIPGFTSPKDNEPETLKKIFVSLWSFIQRITQQLNLVIQAISAAIADSSFAIVGMKIVTNSNGTAIMYSNGWMECCQLLNNVSVTDSFPNQYGSTSGISYYAKISWTYPVPFISPPQFQGTSNYDEPAGGSTTVAVAIGSPIGVSSAQCMVFGRAFGTTTASVFFFAYGYWK